VYIQKDGNVVIFLGPTQQEDDKSVRRTFLARLHAFHGEVGVRLALLLPTPTPTKGAQAVEADILQCPVTSPPKDCTAPLYQLVLQ
jgi:hypothetical protein